MEKFHDYLQYFKELPETSTITFVDQDSNPLDVQVEEGQRLLNDGKDVSIVLRHNIPKDRLINVYDLKLLSGIDYLARNWVRLREDFYKFACEKSDDDRWEDERFRRHMYDQYINVDRPITDQLFNLDYSNLRTLFKYIDEEVEKGTDHLFVDSGRPFKMAIPEKGFTR